MKRSIYLLLAGMLFLTCCSSQGKAVSNNGLTASIKNVGAESDASEKAGTAAKDASEEAASAEKETPEKAGAAGADASEKAGTAQTAASDEKLEEEAVDAILNEYREIAEKYRSEGMEDLDTVVRNGVIPPFGQESKNVDGTSYYYASECHFGEICGGGLEYTGTARVDLNGDGTKELLIGFYDGEIKADEGAEAVEETGTKEEPTLLYAAYSVKGGKIQTLFHGWSRSVYYLAEDGSIIHTGSGGASDYVIIRYELAEDEKGVLSLKEAETLVSESSGDPEKPFTWYPEGRELRGYDENGDPDYFSEKALKMDEETGREYYQKLFENVKRTELQPLK